MIVVSGKCIVGKNVNFARRWKLSCGRFYRLADVHSVVIISNYYGVNESFFGIISTSAACVQLRVIPEMWGGSSVMKVSQRCKEVRSNSGKSDINWFFFG